MSKLLRVRAVMRIVVAVLAVIIAANGLVLGRRLIGDQWVGGIAPAMLAMSVVAMVLGIGLLAMTVLALRERDLIAAARRHPVLETAASLSGILIVTPAYLAIQMASSNPGDLLFVGIALLALAAVAVEVAGALALAKDLRLLLLPAALGALAALVALPGLVNLVARRVGSAVHSVWQAHEDQRSERERDRKALALAATVHGDADLLALARRVGEGGEFSMYDLEPVLDRLPTRTVRSTDTIREFGRLFDTDTLETFDLVPKLWRNYAGGDPDAERLRADRELRRQLRAATPIKIFLAEYFPSYPESFRSDRQEVKQLLRDQLDWYRTAPEKGCGRLELRWLEKTGPLRSDRRFLLDLLRLYRSYPREEDAGDHDRDFWDAISPDLRNDPAFLRSALEVAPELAQSVNLEWDATPALRKVLEDARARAGAR